MKTFPATGVQPPGTSTVFQIEKTRSAAKLHGCTMREDRMRHFTSVIPIVLGLALTPPASAQSARAHYEAGERAIKDARCVDAGREFELAAKLDPANQSYQAKYGEFRHEASKCAQSAGQLLFAAARIGEARIFLEDALRFDPQNAGAAELLE